MIINEILFMVAKLFLVHKKSWFLTESLAAPFELAKVWHLTGVQVLVLDFVDFLREPFGAETALELFEI